MDTIWQDCRYALRRLAHAPFFALFVVLTLAVGIASNTVIFSIADGILFRSLPYPDGDRLVFVSRGYPAFPQGGATFPYAVYHDLQEQNGSFDTVAGYQGFGSLALTGYGEPTRVTVNYVSPSYLPLLGAQPQLGRLLRPEEDHNGSGDAVVVLSHAFWVRQFGADRSIVGAAIRLNERPFTVVGVAAADFRDAPNEEERHEQTDVWMPLGMARDMNGMSAPTDRTGTSTWVVARMKPGMTLPQVREDMVALGQRLANRYPQTDAAYTLVPRPLKGYLLGAFFAPTRILLIASFCLLVIGCVNVANLVFARLLVLRRDLAVRSALGASTWRLVRQLLIEHAVVAALAGCVGLVLAFWGMNAYRAWASLHLPPVVRVHGGAWVFLASVCVSLATGLFFGVAPALVASRVNVQDALSQGGRQGQGLGRRRGQKILVVAEVSLALVVLVAAGMLVESFRRLAATPIGFDTSNLLTLRVELRAERYKDPAARVLLGQRLAEKLEPLTGVKSVTLWGPSMLGRARNVYFAYPEGAAEDDPQARLLMDRHSVNPGALANLGIPLLRGRDLNGRDTADSPPVAVISEGVANALWPGQNPIGKRMRSKSAFTPWVTVVGVAADARQAQRFDLNEASIGIAPTGLGPQFDAYFSYQQWSSPTLTIALRVSDVATVTRELKDTVHSIDPSLPVFDIAMLDDRLATQLGPCRLVAVLSSAYAAMALFLAAFGLFAVLAHEVSQRVHEMGVRMALGAQRRDVLGLVLREGIALTAAGLVVGLVAGLQVSDLIKGFLFGVSPSDPAIYATIASLLGAVALLACWIPARRATRLDPIAILRGE